jgi:hypothetical protein
MRKVIGKVVCKENTGFAPNRFISENTHQMKLMQHYLETNNEDGMFVFLDLEKAFDRVSWNYMKKAVARLGFGPDFCKWIDILYDPNDAPIRQLRINGQEGTEFELKCGTAQGCPLSPLLYLCVMEAFTRMVKTETRVKGITINGHEYKLSQFADDTVLLLSTYQSIEEVWKILTIFEKATGQRVNKTKTEGLLIASLRNNGLDSNLDRPPVWIQWCKDGDYIISLGVPFGNDFDGSPQEVGFWTRIYHTTKSIMARWGAIFRLTLRGRVMIANSMVYSRFRYWTQVMMMPDEINTWLSQDIHELIWRKDSKFVSGQEGQTVKARRSAKESTAKIEWRKGGIGLLMWDEHLKSLRRLWVRRYLDPGTGDWKKVLDYWICKGHTLGRGVLLGTRKLPETPNLFWTTTLKKIETLDFRRRAGRFEDADEAAEEPIWESHRWGPPVPDDNSLWEGPMGIRQVKNLFKRGTTVRWSGNQFDIWAARQGSVADFGGQRDFNRQINTIMRTCEEALAVIRNQTRPPTWYRDELVAYYDDQGDAHYGTIVNPANLRRLKRIRLSAQGDPLRCNEDVTVPRIARNQHGNQVAGPPVWKVRTDGEGRVTGTRGITFPRLEHYRTQLHNGDVMTIDEMNAKEITRDRVNRTTVRPTCEDLNRWPVELRLQQHESINWEEVWDTFKIGLATPVDFGTRFRMIIGDLGTRSKRGEPGGCRLGCGCPEEKHVHLLECPRLQPLWNKLTRILQRARGKPFKRRSQAIIFGWTTRDGRIEKGSIALFSMLLKIINIEFYMVIHKSQAFDYARVWRIFWTRAKRQWDETARDKEYELRNISQRGSKTLSTWIGISRQLSPVGSINRNTFAVTCRIDWKAHEVY